ncbi:MAG: hypothetical protein JWL71_2890 [Acidobacteria bacterium]|nr:hypothetical protein [Acidobacteriota bacterium]
MPDGCGRPIAKGTAAGGREQGHAKRGAVVNAVWIVAGLAALGAVVALIAASQRRGPHMDLGTVSSQWISEHRLGSNQDYSRR